MVAALVVECGWAIAQTSEWAGSGWTTWEQARELGLYPLVRGATGSS